MSEMNLFAVRSSLAMWSAAALLPLFTITRTTPCLARLNR